MDFTTTLGITGAGIVLFGFVLNQFGILSTKSRIYDLLNVVGPGILVVYAILLDSVPFLILNVVWAVASAYSFSKTFKKET